MSTGDLKPCPFCGGEAEPHEVVFPYHYWDVWCDGECFDHFCEKPTEAEAIAAWNTRAERTCKVESCCAFSYDFSPEIYYEFKMQCGGSFDWSYEEPPDYCPNCGRKTEVNK